MSEEYKITKEAILAMAEKCPEAKEALKAGFPKAVEDDRTFDLFKLKNSDYLFTDEEAQRAGFKDYRFMQVRWGGKYGGIAIYLSEKCLKWTLEHDSTDHLCLTVERQ